MSTYSGNCSCSWYHYPLENVGYVAAHDGNGVYTASGVDLRAMQNKSGADYFIYRCCINFDTSSIPVGVVIQSATLRVYVKQVFSVDGFDTFYIVDGSAVTDNSFRTTFEQLLASTTSWGSSDTSGWTVDTLETITLNATGLAGIVKGGTTKLGLRIGRDISASAPTGATGVSIEDGLAVTVDNRPLLTVNYSLPSVGSNLTRKLLAAKML